MYRIRKYTKGNTQNDKIVNAGKLLFFQCNTNLGKATQKIGKSGKTAIFHMCLGQRKSPAASVNELGIGLGLVKRRGVLHTGTPTPSADGACTLVHRTAYI